MEWRNDTLDESGASDVEVSITGIPVVNENDFIITIRFTAGLAVRNSLGSAHIQMLHRCHSIISGELCNSKLQTKLVDQ